MKKGLGGDLNPKTSPGYATDVLSVFFILSIRYRET